MKDWIVGALLSAALAVLAYAGIAQIHKAGHRAGAAEVQSRWNAEQRNQYARYAADLLELKTNNEALQAKLADLDSTHKKENEFAKSENESLHARLRSGAVRLSVPTNVTTCTTSGIGAADVSGPATAATRSAQDRTELDPATAEALVSITDVGDGAIRELNAIIDKYEAIRAARTSMTAPNVQSR